MADQEKKLIIDEGWKEQAQREKEVLAAKEEEEKKKQAAEEPQAGSHGPLPPGTFAALVSMLTTQALFGLGLIRVRGEEEHEPDLEMARYNIDMLEMLQEKTKGNLTAQEQQMLKDTLGDLRMGFVSIANQLAGQQEG